MRGLFPALRVLRGSSTAMTVSVTGAEIDLLIALVFHTAMFLGQESISFSIVESIR